MADCGRGTFYPQLEMITVCAQIENELTSDLAQHSFTGYVVIKTDRVFVVTIYNDL